MYVRGWYLLTTLTVNESRDVLHFMSV